MVRQCLRRLLAARVNDRSLYRDLIAAQNPARILLLSAANEQPAIKTRYSPSALPKKNITHLSFPFFPCSTSPASSLLIPLLFLGKCIYLYPRSAPSSLRICALISLGTRRQHWQALSFSSQKEIQARARAKNKHGLVRREGLFRADYLGTSGSCNLDVCLLRATPVSQHVATEN